MLTRILLSFLALYTCWLCLSYFNGYAQEEKETITVCFTVYVEEEDGVFIPLKKICLIIVIGEPVRKTYI